MGIQSPTDVERLKIQKFSVVLKCQRQKVYELQFGFLNAFPTKWIYGIFICKWHISEKKIKNEKEQIQIH